MKKSIYFNKNRYYKIFIQELKEISIAISMGLVFLSVLHFI